MGILLRASSTILAFPLALATPLQPAPAQLPSAPQPLFHDDFERGLGRWIDASRGNATLVPVGDGHGTVLRLRSDGDVHVLVRGSEAWGDVAIEGDVQFPIPGDAYLGVIYNYREAHGRTDFGLIYLKFGRRAYLQPNPHRDYNVTRTFYPEWEAPLVGEASVRAGEWTRFRMEVVGGRAHFYVGPGEVPALTFPIVERGPGQLGLQPRSVGNEVLVDNVVVRRIERFSYQGPIRPVEAQRAVHASDLAWAVAGPYAATRDVLAQAPASHRPEWRPFATDERGAIATGAVVDYHGPRTVAYFRTIVHADSAGAALLQLSSVDDLTLWVNGRFAGFFPRNDFAWFDHARRAEHRGTHAPVTLERGANTIVLRVRGGTYAAGGFHARVARAGVSLRSPPGDTDHP